jgi:hypothetical protein
VIDRKSVEVAKKNIKDFLNTKTNQNMTPTKYPSTINLINSFKKISTHLEVIGQLLPSPLMIVKKREATVELKSFIRLDYALNF